ncbi:MAG: hypothetical protein K2K56_03830 [Lachnospiraceae bacterium]|nr:hypothetical protein [Lachnospiraceae bacterium]
MILTLTIKENEKKAFDIQVPSEQRIKDTLQVLMENGLIDGTKCESYQVFSVRNSQWLDMKQTYEENGVYTADIVGITCEKENKDER